jgi:hypothetical protein
MIDGMPIFGPLSTEKPTPPPAASQTRPPEDHARVERATPPGVIFWRNLRDAALKVARSERAYGCMAAVRLLARDALRSHRKMREAARDQ